MAGLLWAGLVTIECATGTDNRSKALSDRDLKAIYPAMSDLPANLDLDDLNARTAPEACDSMAEVRDGVDRLDRALVALIKERAGYMEAAARIKPSRDVVRDEARIEDVVSKVVAEAGKVGLAETIAEPVWRELVERSIQYEFSVWDKTR